MMNNASALRSLRTLMCALVILATLAQGALAEEGTELEIMIEDIAGDTGADEAVVEMSDEVILEDALPTSEEISLDGLDWPDLIDGDLTLEDTLEEAPVESIPDAGGLSSNDGVDPSSFYYIAASSVNGIGGAPVNSAPHFIKCCSPEYGFTAIKGDLQLTSDNHIVMCHDSGFTLNENGRIIDYNASNMVRIRSLTYAQCMALQYEKQYQNEYVGVCDFETYIDICARYNKEAFITIRSQYIPRLLNEMMPIIYRYNMQSRCIINSGTIKSLELVRAYDPSIPLSLVIRGGVPTEADMDTVVQLGNCLLTLFCYPSSLFGGIDKLINNEDKLTHARERGLRLFIATIARKDFTQQLIDLGISGAQFKEPPIDPKHDWGEPTYTWSDSYDSVTATRVCRLDSTHRETERVYTTSVSTPATCEIPGAIKYTAVFTNPGFATQTRVVETPPLGHLWNPPTYTWVEDDSAVTAVRVCANDETHVESETAATRSEVIRPATPKRVGKMVYTASFTNPAFKTQTKSVEIPKLPVDEVTAKGGLYLLNHDDKTATFKQPKNNAARVLAISDTVNANGAAYTVTTIADEACSGMGKLTKVTIGANVRTIGAHAFANCPRLKTVNGGAQLTVIRKYAFSACGSLANLPPLSKVSEIGNGAFQKTALREIELGSKLTAIGNTVFNGCTKLKTVSGGRFVTVIGKRAFYGCSALKRLPAFPKLENIKSAAFKGCTVLREISLGTRVRAIGSNAFNGCEKLRSITVKTKRLESAGIGSNAFKGIFGRPVVHCPKSRLKAYKALFRRKGLPKGATFDSL